MKNSQKKGIAAALVGIGAGALAWWQYKRMSPEQKKNLKSKVSNAGDRIKDTAKDVESSISEKYNELKGTAKEKVEQAKS
ncbi:YtxH domain-containing protein [Marixanthomonas sp. SCSIO 43207]|uniref:YtxH domain-containing protein n=1 Tax=Marixanthomonas sp. SCSIO 43207 TaxID=2779360 RepID=UPI001CA9C784|nr:YtxH domain-containing protein [Marixanthomonas sp. SCSIO 43207]UAB80626.1 YtxH domain-containing protein [Marixanthomonas sp. SCSIO 43207]